MTTTFHCKNCRFSFRADAAQVCPRCYSKEITGATEEKTGAAAKPHETHASREPRRIILGDTKGAWHSFHASETKACPQCGGIAFEFDWKHKEKTCKNCGSIFPLARRQS
ncbi:MAG: hypothetical protein V1811_00670 [Candidatus Micrarchaeota archaeon]